jgi:hypothetical protein
MYEPTVARGPPFDIQAISYILRHATMYIHVINTDTESIRLYLLSVTAKMSDVIRSPVISLLLHLKSAAEDIDLQSADWNND